MKVLRTVCYAAVLVGFSAQAAFAQTQGGTGGSSTGTSNISVTIPRLVQITQVSNLTSTITNASNIATGLDASLDITDTVCVYSNDNTGFDYSVTLSGNGAGNSGANNVFSITDGTNTIVYTAHWADASNGTGEDAVTTATALDEQTGSNFLDCDDTSGVNARVRINFLRDNLLQVPHGTYTGVLTILINTPTA